MKSWQPVLTGSLAQRARRVVDEIAAVLVPGAASSAAGADSSEPDPGAAPPAPSAADTILANPTLAGGTAGAALFFAYRAQSGAAGGGGEADNDSAAFFLDRSTDALASTPLAPDLYGGFTGVAWAAEHLYSPRFADPGGEPDAAAAGAESAEPEVEDPLEEIDGALSRYLDRTPWTADYDLIRGLAGFGVYALERLPRPGAVACLTRIVDRLSETAEHGPAGTTWHTAPELLPDWQRQLFPGGYYNLGVAHGVPAVIALLSATADAMGRLGAAGDRAAAELAPRARSLAGGATRWLLAQRLPPGQGSWFGGTFTPEQPAQGSRLAWCYGDPGIAASLLVTARAAGDAALERLAVELAVDAAARPAAASGVRDAGLCHGSAGLAHLFNRLYQETGEPRLAAASRHWFEQALDFQLPGEGFAGYRAYWIEPDGNVQSWRSEAGLLEGVAGIGLALLGGLGDFEPSWDRVLMLSTAVAAPRA
ncbi:MAG: lanthionine synthetase C family protein [Acidobacteria bacterium]|nr:lanthionine synthetase C family protein [Acidobacteriota bacterium]